MSKKKKFNKINLPPVKSNNSIAKKFISSSDIISKNLVETIEIDKSLLVPYKDKNGNPQPFKLHSEEKHLSLIDSIKRLGLLHPIVVRKIDNYYQILAGHNRVKACINFDKIKSSVVNVDDDTAHLIVLETNLEQREQLLPSEKAIAIAEKMEILNRQGKTYETKVDSATEIAEQLGESRANIFKYKRIANLNKSLLAHLDNERMTLKAAYELAVLPFDKQLEISNILDTSTSKINDKVASQIISSLNTSISISDIINNPKKESDIVSIKVSVPIIYKTQIKDISVLNEIDKLVLNYLQSLQC